MEMEGSLDAWDLPPEYCHYRDEGCELAAACLDCTFSRCVYDQPGGKQHWLKVQRDREMLRLFSVGSQGVKEVAEKFGVSERTVQRALKSAGKGGKSGQ